MAGGNWATFGQDHITSEMGVTVGIYKNQLYVTDEKAWEAGSIFSKPTVMQVQSGNFTYKDINIYAERDYEDNIFVVVTTQGKDPMISCGVYGFGETGEWLGVTEAHKQTLDVVFKNWEAEQ